MTLPQLHACSLPLRPRSSCFLLKTCGHLSLTSRKLLTANKADREFSKYDNSLGKDEDLPASENVTQPKPKKAKTVAQADEELRELLEQMSGGGGASGVEYEDGKPNTMKRSVRNNMFRYI
ncbi:uncharacterized protein ATNIH1004_004160 [Aspergillus tanneri]|uniref:Uncharacterized protein n=1 Tax=Aspergillus tanneri TaxID=1220188 RepID=A0A5M9MQT0_9EURO|nr:uncharacterized protein ATNIH1004_004160 [Aspergillus tanneri]KAA8648276.1 hypothetical protein ATNIH1004_004160 [Aspergillus tanneri]